MHFDAKRVRDGSRQMRELALSQSVQILPSAIFRSEFGWGFDIWIFI